MRGRFQKTNTTTSGITTISTWRISTITFTSTATQHGGQETTLFSVLTNLLHFGLTIVGLDYGYAGQMGVGEVKGGAPYGATTVADGDGSRQPSEADLGGARYLGERVAKTAAKLIA